MFGSGELEHLNRLYRVEMLVENLTCDALLEVLNEQSFGELGIFDGIPPEGGEHHLSWEHTHVWNVWNVWKGSHLKGRRI